GSTDEAPDRSIRLDIPFDANGVPSDRRTETLDEFGSAFGRVVRELGASCVDRSARRGTNVEAEPFVRRSPRPVSLDRKAITLRSSPKAVPIRTARAAPNSP